MTGSAFSWKEMREINRVSSAAKLARGELVANTAGWGAGDVQINFVEMVGLTPTIPPQWNIPIMRADFLEQDAPYPPVPQ